MSKIFATDMLTTLLDAQLGVAGISNENAHKIELQLIDLEGLHYLIPEKGMLFFDPDGWKHFIDDLSSRNLQHFLPATSFDSMMKVIKEWQNWLAKNGVDMIENGEMDFHQLRESNPRLFDTPIIQSALAKHFIENGGITRASKKGRPPNTNRELLNLCGWASHYYHEDPDITLLRACEMAVSNYPELIPQSWNVKTCDPEDLEFEWAEKLKKDIGRIEKQHPGYNLKLYRDARSKN